MGQHPDDDDNIDDLSILNRYNTIISEIETILIRNKIGYQFKSITDLKEFVGTKLWPMLRSEDSFANPFDTHSQRNLNSFVNKFIHDVKGIL